MFLGPDPGYITNSKKWQMTTPQNYTSPYLCHGDIGFFSYKNRRYGQFLLVVQTYTKKIFVLKMINLKVKSFLAAFEIMLKVYY